MTPYLLSGMTVQNATVRLTSYHLYWYVRAYSMTFLLMFFKIKTHKFQDLQMRSVLAE